MADVGTLIGAALVLLRVERGAVDSGPFTEVQTVTLDANLTSYSISDPGGTPGDWYRWRFSESDDSNPTAYRGPLVSIDAYATITELLRGGTSISTDATNIARIADLLETATREIDRELGWGFRPVTGTWHFRTNGRMVQVPGGLISVTTVGVRTSPTGSYVPTTEYDLLPETPPPGEPYRTIRLHRPVGYLGSDSFWIGAQWNTADNYWNPAANYTYNVEVTGTRGWATAPSDIRESVIARARQGHAADPSLSGGVPAWADGPSPVASQRLPDVMWRALKFYRAWQVILG